MLALFLALASPELDVRGVTVSYGNTVVENAYRNAVEIMRRAGKRITLGVGARRSAPALVRARVARHVAMIGNIAAQGNTTRYAEFNAWCDPEALALVLKAELPTEIVGLDVTRQALLAPQEITRLGTAGAPHARWIQDALRFYMEFHKRAEGLDGCIVNDVLPIAALVKPAALTFEEQRLVVDLEEGDHRGHTRPDPQGARVRVATAADMGRVRCLLSERAFRWAARPAAAPSRSQEARA